MITTNPVAAAEALADDVAELVDELETAKETIAELEAEKAAGEVKIREDEVDEAFMTYLLDGGDPSTYDHVRAQSVAPGD